VQGGNLFLHAVLVSVFVALTAPVTTIFLMRAALFRDRQTGAKLPHASEPPGSAPALKS
jgi:multicomponent K+:H+ antiporter subunit G